MIQHEKHTNYVAKENNQVVGVIEVLTITHQNHPLYLDKTYALIDKLAVKSHYKEKGISTQLIDFAEQEFKQKGITEIEIYVWEFNDVALHLYERTS